MSLWPEGYAGPFHDDRDAVARFQRGEAEVLDALYRAWLPSVERWLRKGGQGGGSAVADPVLRQDLVHDVFVKTFTPENRARFDDARPFGPWLMVITRNVATSWFRRASLRRRGDAEVDEQGPDPREPSLAETAVEHRELAALLDEFVDGLTTEERQILHLLVDRHAGRITQSAAAAKLGTSHTRLRRLERGLLSRLHRWLRSKGYLSSLIGAAALLPTTVSPWTT